MNACTNRFCVPYYVTNAKVVSTTEDPQLSIYITHLAHSTNMRHLSLR